MKNVKNVSIYVNLLGLFTSWLVHLSNNKEIMIVVVQTSTL